MKEVTRAQFLRRSAVAAGGFALFEPLSALAGTSGQPRPIPGGFDSNFQPVPVDPLVHVLPPGLGFEASTIGDFNGALGAADIQGTAHGSDGSAYDFDCDMRFMRGAYVDTTGRVREGSFGFIWIDLYAPGHVGDPSNQVHDFNPGIAPNGLFWTMAVTHAAIEVDPGRGTAHFRAENLPVPDYHDLINAIFGGSPPVPGHVTFDVSWGGGGSRQHLRDTTYGFVGQYRTGPAKINFSVKDDAGNVVFTSDAGGQTNGLPPEVGHERNGVFFS